MIGKNDKTFVSSIQNVPDVKMREIFISQQENIRNSAQTFLEIFNEKENPYCLAFWLLKEWSNWLTPANFGNRQRFDTLFYILCSEEETGFTLCERELQDAQWSTPAEALSRPMMLAPPQIYELSRLASFSSLDELRSFAEVRETYGITRFCPQFIHCSDGITISVLPGDSLYKAQAGEYVKPYSMNYTSKVLKNSSETWHRCEFRPKGPYPFGQWSIQLKNLKRNDGHLPPVVLESQNYSQGNL